ncbi:hypothetical protein DFQ14_112100 [Halopolyspora algeriensis]|uniref:CU044_5270 family protein n=1 Tax=Halopolyspora algeriensis TaxID=1500506 RepID=A0A368VIM4_9ACTN|nr:CU044_5270 family protein [Halopolyspora algeriensis]RCW40219.1 hypothetical protein DFQ14_112100 [Halopolyspora algeriensis]TQM46300.1 hypothetical protein FHU43_3971 [Halopolyspora algeriensis]
MKHTEQHIRELMGPLDPMRDDERAAVPPPHPTGIIDTEQPAARRHRPRARTRRAVLAGAAATVLVAGGLVWTTAGPNAPEGYAATPPLLEITPPQRDLPAAERLHAIADRAEVSGVPKGAPGQTEYIKMENWYLHSQIDNSGTVSVIQPSTFRLWRHADGSGRSVIRAQPPQFRSEAGREKWAGDTSGSERVHRWGAGERTYYWDERPPVDADALRRWLRQRPSGQTEPLRTFSAITDLLRNRVLLPQERAAVLRVLAELPGMRYNGTTRDRAGRPGRAFSLESDGSGLPTRYTFILGPDNGRFLGYEEMLTTSAGKLNVPIPSVISYSIFLERKFVER